MEGSNDRRLHEGMTYVIEEHFEVRPVGPGRDEMVKIGETITCRVCGMTSHNPNDIQQRYCASCHQFHEIMESHAMAQLRSQFRSYHPDQDAVDAVQAHTQRLLSPIQRTTQAMCNLRDAMRLVWAPSSELAVRNSDDAVPDKAEIEFHAGPEQNEPKKDRAYYLGEEGDGQQ